MNAVGAGKTCIKELLELQALLSKPSQLLVGSQLGRAIVPQSNPCLPCQHPSSIQKPLTQVAVPAWSALCSRLVGTDSHRDEVPTVGISSEIEIFRYWPTGLLNYLI